MSGDPWDCSDCDPVADIKAAINWLKDPKRFDQWIEHHAENEKRLNKAIQFALDTGMSPEEIFECINYGVII